jgi:hypothetical protein
LASNEEQEAHQAYLEDVAKAAKKPPVWSWLLRFVAERICTKIRKPNKRRKMRMPTQG